MTNTANDTLNNSINATHLDTNMHSKPNPHSDLQDKLVKDSIANNQNITAQAQARQSPAPKVKNKTIMNTNNTATDNNKTASPKTNDFTQVQDLPVGTPQGQQTTLPNNDTTSAATDKQAQSQTNNAAVKKTAFNQRDDINNPHTPDTDGLEQTHFGYKTVNKAEKQARVADVFTSVAKKYDIMNDLMSFGIHRLWKRFAISLSGVRAGQKVLDIAGGTGDLAKVFSREVGRHGHVVLSDINAAMLEVGRERLINAGCNNVDFVLANAETLAPFDDESFDLLTISFGLRNVTDKDAALRSMYRVLKPGGRLLILEFSKPIFEPLSKAYDLYSFTALPMMGKIVANDAESYQYLAESIRMHPNQQTLKQMMQQAGFVNCDYHNLTAGIVAVHRGFKA